MFENRKRAEFQENLSPLLHMLNTLTTGWTTVHENIEATSANRRVHFSRVQHVLDNVDTGLVNTPSEGLLFWGDQTSAIHFNWGSKTGEVTKTSLSMTRGPKD